MCIFTCVCQMWHLKKQWSWQKHRVPRGGAYWIQQVCEAFYLPVSAFSVPGLKQTFPLAVGSDWHPLPPLSGLLVSLIWCDWMQPTGTYWQPMLRLEIPAAAAALGAVCVFLSSSSSSLVVAHRWGQILWPMCGAWRGRWEIAQPPEVMKSHQADREAEASEGSL